MSLIPKDKLTAAVSFNLAPMIDFLFLMLAFFATLAVTRATLYDSNLDLVQLQSQNGDTKLQGNGTCQNINISISKDGQYKWITDMHDYPMQNDESVQKELVYQYKTGFLPEDKKLTQVFLHIDKTAPWDAIATLIYSIREIGFNAMPIYQPISKGDTADNSDILESFNDSFDADDVIR